MDGGEELWCIPGRREVAVYKDGLAGRLFLLLFGVGSEVRGNGAVVEMKEKERRKDEHDIHRIVIHVSELESEVAHVGVVGKVPQVVFLVAGGVAGDVAGGVIGAGGRVGKRLGPGFGAAGGGVGVWVLPVDWMGRGFMSE